MMAPVPAPIAPPAAAPFSRVVSGLDQPVAITARPRIRIMRFIALPPPVPLAPPLVREEAREEVLHAVAEVGGAVTHLLPPALGLGLGGLPRLLHLLARELRAFDDGLADPLGCVLDALADLPFADLLGAGLHLLGGGLHLGLVGGDGGQRRARDQRAGEHDDSESHEAPPDSDRIRRASESGYPAHPTAAAFQGAITCLLGRCCPRCRPNGPPSNPSPSGSSPSRPSPSG